MSSYQQEQPYPHLQSSQKFSQTHHAPLQQLQKITGWDDEPVLIQQSLNTFCSKLNQSKQKKRNTNININNNVYNQREKQPMGGRRRCRRISGNTQNICRDQNGKIIDGGGSQNVDPLAKQGGFGYAENRVYDSKGHINVEDNKQVFNGQFSHIEVLKFQVKHLQKQQFTKGRFPTFSGSNHSQVLSCDITQNSTKLSYKSRSNSNCQKQSKNNRRQTSASQSSNHSSAHQNPHLYPNTNKFYKTLTNQWLNSKNPCLIVQGCLSSHNSYSQNSQLAQKYYSETPCNPKPALSDPQLKQLSIIHGQNCIINTPNVCREQYKTIHWKKNRPFTKFFQGKKKRVQTSLLNSSNTNKNGKGNIKQIEGRKLFQLLTLNRQIIQIQDV